MANYAVANPGKYHLGFNYPSPPYQNVTYDILRIPFKEVRWKASSLLNRRIYVGNVKITKSDGSIHVEPDTIYKSRVNKFDTFTESGKITVASGDGEDIIALVDYADRILQFKDKTLHIINAQQKEFLEDSHKHKGVSNVQAVVKTDFGVAWANAHGAYLYDGRTITDLIERKGMRSMTFAQWDTFVTDKVTIGYVPDKRQLIIVDAYDSSASGDLFIYDMVTKSWVKGKGKLDTDKSNFSTSHSGKLIFSEDNGSNQSIYAWDDTADTTGNLLIKTADIDFEQPGIKKKVNTVYITYKSTGAPDTAVTYGVNGETSLTKAFDTALVSTSGAWSTIQLKPNDPTESSGIYSIQLQIEIGTATTADFSINDISIVYRPKRVK